MSDNPTEEASGVAPRIERGIERALFAARWIALPIYLGFILALLLLVVKFIEEGYDVAKNIIVMTPRDAIIAALRLIDLSLLANLVTTVMLAGYDNFISRIAHTRAHADRPDWLDNIDFASLKIKLISSIVAISSIDVLERFIDIDHQDRNILLLSAGLLLTFATAGVLIAWMDNLTHGKE